MGVRGERERNEESEGDEGVRERQKEVGGDGGDIAIEHPLAFLERRMAGGSVKEELVDGHVEGCGEE